MTPDDLHRREKELADASWAARVKGETFTWTVTRDDLTRDHRHLPADKIEPFFLKERFAVQIYDRIVFQDEGQEFVLKDRHAIKLRPDHSALHLNDVIEMARSSEGVHAAIQQLIAQLEQAFPAKINKGE